MTLPNPEVTRLILASFTDAVESYLAELEKGLLIPDFMLGSVQNLEDACDRAFRRLERVRSFFQVREESDITYPRGLPIDFGEEH